MTASRDPLTDALTGALPLILIVAVPLAGFASLLILGMYRRAVVRSMSRSAGSAGAAGATGAAADTPAHLHAATALRVDLVRHGSPVPAGPAARRILREAVRAPWRVAAIYAAAGAVYAAAMAVFFLAAAGFELLPVRFLLLAWVFAWPVVLTLDLVASATRRTRLALAGAYVLGLAGLAALATARSPDFSAAQVATLWATTNLAPTLLVLGFLGRRVRAVGPLLLVFTLIAVLGAIVTPSLVVADDRIVRLVIEAWFALGLGERNLFLDLSGLGILLFGGVGGLLALRWIRARYERKRISDQSLRVDAVWLFFAVAHAVPLAFEGAAWILAGPAAFLLFRACAGAGLALQRRRAAPAADAPRLLLLRVFRLGRRSERLFDVLGLHWRHVGSVQLIAGPDLATTTIEPHELLDFLSGRLDRQFIDGPAALEHRLGTMDLLPDRDGRFRVHDFFCFDDAWRMVLSRLARESDAVLMDLRSYSAGNAGCRWEIGELIDLVPLERVLFLVDATTDESFLRESLEEAWRRMGPGSPNRGAAAAPVRVFRARGAPERDLPALLAALCSAARPEPPGPAPDASSPGAVRALG